MADLRQVVFSQIGHFHDGIAVNTVLEHGSCNFKDGFSLAFFNNALFSGLIGCQEEEAQHLIRFAASARNSHYSHNLAQSAESLSCC